MKEWWTIKKPKIGLLTLAGEWVFNQDILLAETVRRLEENQADISSTIGKSLEVVDVGIVKSAEQAVDVAERFRKMDIDLIVACHQLYDNDKSLLAATEILEGTPLLLWCYSPNICLPTTMTEEEMLYGTGPLGSLHAVGILNRLGKEFYCVSGSHHEKDVIDEITDYAMAAMVAKQLKVKTIAHIPGRCDVMTDLYVDEFKLKNIMGPHVHQISLHALKSILDTIDETAAASQAESLKASYEIGGVSDNTLQNSVRASMTFSKVVDRWNVDALAVNDTDAEFMELFGRRPFIDAHFGRGPGIIIGLEGDLLCTTAMIILHMLTSGPVMLAEIFTFSRTDNTILAGHGGPQNLLLADNNAAVVPDYEVRNVYENATFEFSMKPGPITLTCLFQGKEGFKMIIATATSIRVEGMKLRGYPHVYARLNSTVDKFFKTLAENGATHHWAVVESDVSGRLEMLASILGIESIKIE